MGIFQDAQGQLTISPWSDPAEFQTHSSFYGCPCYTTLSINGHNNIYQFIRFSKEAYSIGDGILTKFKLIQALIVVLLVCKNEKDPFKIESTRVDTTCPHYKTMGIFPNAQGHVTHKSLVGSCRISNPWEIL